MRISNQGLAAVLLGGHGHIIEPESSRNIPYRHSSVRTEAGLHTQSLEGNLVPSTTEGSNR